MKTYLGDKTIYVENDIKLIYKVESIEAYDGYDSLHLNLTLVAGWDYINPDENNVQGWCPASRFVEDVQSETVIHYFIKESMKEALEANDYTVIVSMSGDLKRVIEASELSE